MKNQNGSPKKLPVKIIDQIYINGQFVKPHGTERFELINPSINEVIGEVTLGDEEDTRKAIAAAKEAFKIFSKTTKQQRLEYLQRLHECMAARREDLIAAMVEEYGAPLRNAKMMTEMAITNSLQNRNVLEKYEFVKDLGESKVIQEPVGVAGIITPWNSNAGFITGKFSTALAAGCTAVIKPSEMSAIQTQIVIEAIHEAGLPPGVFNVVNGRGDVVGAELTRHPDIAKISFTGSTLVGKTIARGSVDTLKRITLELGGKSPNIILDDANFAEAVPMAVSACFMNNGQACIAGTRLLVPEDRLEEVKKLAKAAVEAVRVGDPRKEDTTVGPLVSRKQYERVQRYIQLGIEQGAELVIGGEGHPQGLEAGNFVKPTVFARVTPEMTIAREEIFGPVLSIMTYKTEAHAIEIANDTVYGLQAYVSSGNVERANRVASQISAGRVLVNCLKHDSRVPFGGFKQSGVGREYSEYGLAGYLEPKSVVS
jgi:aldehyde dehydrogenase (NAD+)